METIDFEGKIVAPKNGVYKCPYSCHDKRYPAKKWKSEKGFRQHMDTCPGRPSAKAAADKQAAERNAEMDVVKAEVLASLEHKIGDTISYVREIIVKDTHEWRGDRRVHVRYEAVKRFEARQEKITSISFVDAYLPDVNAARRLVRINGAVMLFDIRPDFETAKQSAADRQKAYDEHVKFSQDVR